MCSFQGSGAKSLKSGKSEQIKDAYYAEPVESLVVEATEGPIETMKVKSESEYAKNVKTVYPHAE